MRAAQDRTRGEYAGLSVIDQSITDCSKYGYFTDLILHVFLQLIGGAPRPIVFLWARPNLQIRDRCFMKAHGFNCHWWRVVYQSKKGVLRPHIDTTTFVVRPPCIRSGWAAMSDSWFLKYHGLRP